jgi:hypothetical protein
MKVLTAARLTWSGVEVGFCGCPLGELVRLGDSCECDCHPDDDDDCGCELDCRDDGWFLGLVSNQETTTARVEERNISCEQLAAAIRDSMGRAGWFGPGLDPQLESAIVDLEVGRIRRVVDCFPAGTLVGVTHGFPFEVTDSRNAG